MRCYFHLVNDHEEILDETGLVISSLEDAKHHALVAICELRRDASEVSEEWDGWRLEIVCSQGRLLHSLRLNENVH
jgi:hypothetical protein